MGFYNFSRILRGIIYGVKGITKYLFYSLFIVAFIVVCLLLMSNKSNAQSTFTEQDIYDRYEVALSDFTTRVGPSNVGQYAIVDRSDRISIYFTSLSDSYSSFRVSNGYFQTRSIGVYDFYINQDANTFVYQYSFGNYTWYSQSIILEVLFNSNDILDTANQVSIPSNPVQGSFVAPIFVNYDDSNWGDSLVTGEFYYFYINANDTSKIILYFYDETYSIGNEDGIFWGGEFDENSPYAMRDGNDNLYWAFRKDIPFGSYQNNHNYHLSFQYLDNDGHYQSSQVYQWTTDFSQQVIDDEQSSVMGDINKGINDTNNFLNDKNYNKSDITSNMPNSDSYVSPTDEGIDNIFTSFVNAFTSSNTQTVRFVIPNSNGQYIDIPSDLVTSKLPQPILILIQSFYWFLICRYIVKDISKIAEKAKSGEILDGNSDR